MSAGKVQASKSPPSTARMKLHRRSVGFKGDHWLDVYRNHRGKLIEEFRQETAARLNIPVEAISDVVCSAGAFVIDFTVRFPNTNSTEPPVDKLLEQCAYEPVWSIYFTDVAEGVPPRRQGSVTTVSALPRVAGCSKATQTEQINPMVMKQTPAHIASGSQRAERQGGSPLSGRDTSKSSYDSKPAFSGRRANSPVRKSVPANALQSDRGSVVSHRNSKSKSVDEQQRSQGVDSPRSERRASSTTGPTTREVSRNTYESKSVSSQPRGKTPIQQSGRDSTNRDPNNSYAGSITQSSPANLEDQPRSSLGVEAPIETWPAPPSEGAPSRRASSKNTYESKSISSQPRGKTPLQQSDRESVSRRSSPSSAANDERPKQGEVHREAIPPRGSRTPLEPRVASSLSQHRDSNNGSRRGITSSSGNGTGRLCSDGMVTRHWIGFEGERWSGIVQERCKEVKSSFLQDVEDSRREAGIFNPVVQSCTYAADKCGLVIECDWTHSPSLSAVEVDGLLSSRFFYENIWDLYFDEPKRSISNPHARKKRLHTYCHSVVLRGSGWREVVRDDWSQVCEAFVNDVMMMGDDVHAVFVAGYDLLKSLVLNADITYSSAVSMVEMQHRLDSYPFSDVWAIHNEHQREQSSNRKQAEKPSRSLPKVKTRAA